MANQVFFPHAILLGIALVALSPATPVFAQGRHGYAPSSLNDAYVTLANAKPVYKGHRAKALGHIRTAVNLLGGKIAGKGKDRETSGDSDAKLRTAQQLLQQSRNGLSGTALNHVNEAISEISRGLSAR